MFSSRESQEGAIGGRGEEGGGRRGETEVREEDLRHFVFGLHILFGCQYYHERTWFSLMRRILEVLVHQIPRITSRALRGRVLAGPCVVSPGVRLRGGGVAHGSRGTDTGSAMSRLSPNVLTFERQAWPHLYATRSRQFQN